MLKVLHPQHGDLEIATADQRQYAMTQLEKGYRLLQVTSFASPIDGVPVTSDQVDDQHDFYAIAQFSGG